MSLAIPSPFAQRRERTGPNHRLCWDPHVPSRRSTTGQNAEGTIWTSRHQNPVQNRSELPPVGRGARRRCWCRQAVWIYPLPTLTVNFLVSLLGPFGQLRNRDLGLGAVQKPQASGFTLVSSNNLSMRGVYSVFLVGLLNVEGCQLVGFMTSACE